jgi:hypothetical protein
MGGGAGFVYKRDHAQTKTGRDQHRALFCF